MEIKGNLSCTYDACMLILEQIECFRNGGPVSKLIIKDSREWKIY